MLKTYEFENSPLRGGDPVSKPALQKINVGDQDTPVLCRLSEWASLRTRLDFVYDGRIPYGSGEGLFVRSNGEVSAWLIRRGHASVEVGGKKLTVSPGQWLITAARCVRQKLSSDAELLSLRFHHNWPDGENLFSPDTFCVFEAKGNEALEQIALEIVNVDNGRSVESGYAFMWLSRVDHSTYVRQQGLLLLLIGELSKILTKKQFKLHIHAAEDSRLAQALRVVDTEELDRPFPSFKVVATSGLGIRQLNKICEKSYGITLHQYWEKRRLDRARRSLEQGAVEIKALSLNLGFSQLSYFSAWFKKHTGLPPRGYRRLKQASLK